MIRFENFAACCRIQVREGVSLWPDSGAACGGAPRHPGRRRLRQLRPSEPHSEVITSLLVLHVHTVVAVYLRTVY